MNKKMTKREMFNALKEKYDFNEVEVAFIDHELELLDNKNKVDKKPTANQVANEGIKDTILNAMSVGVNYTVTEIQKALDLELSNQKVSALVRQLVAEGKLVRVEDKRKAYFSKVEG